MLNFNELLDPVSAAAPAGEDMTFAVEVDAINKARQFDDPSLDQGEWVVAIKEADWGFVYQNCAHLLRSKTKDLRLAAWLVEAAAKTRQFEGLAAGFELLAQLSDRYWETLYPSLDDGDPEQRLGNLAWLLARSVQLVKEIPLTQGRGTSFSWLDFEAARARANTALRSGESVSSSAEKPDLAVLEAARRKSAKAFYEGLMKSAAHCHHMLAELERALDARLGVDGPSFMLLRDTLDTVRNTVERFGVEAGVTVSSGATPDNAVNGAGAQAQVAGAAEGAAPAFSGAISSRGQALEQLRLVADFFRRTEPHSPVTYLADKAAHWADLPLHTWLKTVVKDAGSLAFIEEMLGVKAGESSD